MRGPEMLTDAELISIFFGSGRKNQTAVDLAREVLVHFGSLSALLRASQGDFCSCQGLGEVRYARVQAAMELSRRHVFARLQQGEWMDSRQLAEEYLISRLGTLAHEVFGALFLNSQHRVLAFEDLFRGTLDGASVYPREVVKRALHHNAAAVIFSHNHPSGIAEPSAEDRRITTRLAEALGLIGVRVLDHIVVGNGVATSFSQRGYL